MLHDLPGLGLARGSEPTPHGPSEQVRSAVLDLLARGQGLVVTHHALAGWPQWDQWAEIIGGRFFYTAGTLRGEGIPASGYRMDRYQVDVVDPDHPVCAGVESFELDDELYLCPVLSDEVTPLLATTADLVAASMIDTYREVRYGERVAPAQQPASSLLGWAKTHGPSRVVYLLPGHGPSTMQHPSYRRLLANACHWASRGDEARGDGVHR